MEATIFTVLTNKSMRDKPVKEILDGSIVELPWF